MTDDEGREAAIEALLAVLDDPDWGRRHLPKIVGYLDHDDRDVRAGAGWAIAIVADEHPDAAEYLARRLGDRLADVTAAPSDEDVRHPNLAVERALGAVSLRYPEVVEAELAALDSESENVDQRSVGASMVRANYHAPGPGDRPVGRLRFPNGTSSDDPRQVYTAEDSSRPQPRRISPDVAGEDGEDGGDGMHDGDERGPPGRELWARTDYLQQIADASRFDALQITAPRSHGRYGDVYRTRATVAGEDLPVALALFHCPAETDAFAADLDDALARWNAVDDHEHVLTIHDWGLEPRPWALTEYAGDSLRSIDRLSLEDALWSATALSNGLAHAHEQGVVHAGIDPETVVYYGNLLDEDERQSPLYTNVAVLSPVREYFDPTGLLDPRYAAPEYFERRYGRVDHATDIYQLGAVIYRLVTGTHPYSGEYEDVRDAVLQDGSPRPSAVVDVPAALDDVVTKAMAREKLRRYESVTHLAADLRATGAPSDAA